MTTAWVNLAARVSLGDVSAQVVLLSLARWADDHGGSSPSNAALARATGMTERNVRYVLGRLVDLGMVRKFYLPRGRRLVLVAGALDSVDGCRADRSTRSAAPPPLAGGRQPLPGGRQPLPPMNQNRVIDLDCRAVENGHNVNNRAAIAARR